MINNQLGEAPRWLFIIAYSARPHRIIVKYRISSNNFNSYLPKLTCEYDQMRIHIWTRSVC